jgi:hypothetical protein
MKHLFKILLAPLALSIVLAGCGNNPFGPGSSSLSFFAKIGKAIEKPSAINDKENSKDGSKNMVTPGSLQKGLAKSLARDSATPAWVTDKGLIVRGDTVFYFEDVVTKPKDDDPYKTTTGHGEVGFMYNGATSSLTLDNIVVANITGIYSFHFKGSEKKTWSGELDTVEYSVRFQNPTLLDLKPGHTTAWAKNISSTIALGQGDTASFALDSLYDTAEYGEGHFYDAHSGKQNTEGPKAFDFTLEVIHINSLDPTKPFLRYQDNEGIMHFYLPYGISGDSLYFTVHFFPPYNHPAYDREGEIRKNGPDGPRLVYFKVKEMTQSGTVVYYDENGKEIGSE